MNSNNKRKNAVNIYRVSSDKQFLAGNSLEDQKKLCKTVNDRYNHKLIKEFELVETGADKDRLEFERVLSFCKDTKNKVEVIVIKSIDRITRGGDVVYGLLKSQLARFGIEIVDAYGFIQPEQNTLKHLEVEYDWSRFTPSENAEAMEANRAKQERRDILTRVIGAEIIYTRQGYGVRAAPFGFANTKTETPHGKRTIRVPRSPESDWIKMMFDMRVEGVNDKEIVEAVNKKGFKTRVQKIRDKRTRKVIGTRGGKPLTVKQLQRYIKKPIYAGYIVEKWTEGQPIKAKFPGLVSVATFNEANKGKVVIVEDEVVPQLLRNKSPTRRQRYNPLYPFKAIKCPRCGKELITSAPTNGSGNPSPRYHCARGHKHWSVNRKDFHDNIYSFILDLDFSSEFVQLFKEVVLDVWNQHRQDALEEAQAQGRRALELEAEKQELLTVMKAIKDKDSIAFQVATEDLDRVGTELEYVKNHRNKEEQKELDIEELVNYAGYLMERVDVLLVDTDNSAQQRALFGLVFDEMPNYDEIVNRTVKLSPSFALKQEPELSKSQLVTLPGIEPGIRAKVSIPGEKARKLF